MNVHYSTPAEEDMLYWRQHSKKITQRIESIIEDIRQHPFSGIGNPGPLRFQWAGYWSRRINKIHRLVYKVHKDCVYVVQCKYHY
jgi:toxin YoeB